MKASYVKCDVCGKTFNCKKSMTNHRRWHNIPKYISFQSGYKEKSNIFSKEYRFKEGHKLWDNINIKNRMINNISGNKNNNYIDGRSKTDWFKYKLIYVSGKLVLEHRYLMEKLLNRTLNKEEVVDHIDGNPKNNSLDNLRLFKNNSEHIKYHRNKRRGGSY